MGLTFDVTDRMLIIALIVVVIFQEVRILIMSKQLGDMRLILGVIMAGLNIDAEELTKAAIKHAIDSFKKVTEEEDKNENG